MSWPSLYWKSTSRTEGNLQTRACGASFATSGIDEQVGAAGNVRIYRHRNFVNSSRCRANQRAVGSRLVECNIDQEVRDSTSSACSACLYRWAANGIPMRLHSAFASEVIFHAQTKLAMNTRQNPNSPRNTFRTSSHNRLKVRQDTQVRRIPDQLATDLPEVQVLQGPVDMCSAATPAVVDTTAAMLLLRLL